MVNVRPVNTCFDNELGEKFDKSIHLCATCDRASQPLIDTSGFTLTQKLLCARLPIKRIASPV